MKTKIRRLIGLVVVLCLLVPLAYLISRMDIDWDRDGFTKAQEDCDNWDATEFPDQLWYADCDGDAFKRTGAVEACDLAKAKKGTPCMDGFAPDGGWSHVKPGASSADCDDEDLNEFPGQLWYPDCDGDTFKSANAVKTCDLNNVASPCADGRALEGGWTDTKPGKLADCDDTDPSAHPGAKEVVGDGLDNDCDGRVDETG